MCSRPMLYSVENGGVTTAVALTLDDAVIEKLSFDACVEQRCI